MTVPPVSPTSAAPSAFAPASFYVVSGTLPLTSQSYVARQADRDLLSSLLAGEYCFVLNSRQMGKSSLSVRTMARLKESGVRTVFLDLTKIGGSNVTPEQWYIGLLSETGRALDLRQEMLAYWKEHQEYSLVQRYFGALHDVALAQIASPLVLFIDEIDAVKSLPFSTDEFFAAVRECYNRRVQEPEYERLTFALVGSATASDLIKDTRTSPFNIGKRIELRDFTPAEAAPLAEGLVPPSAPADNIALSKETGKRLLERVLYWTGGHPYLTQRLCRSAAESGVRSASEVDRLCTELFLTHTAQESDDNLAFIRNRLLRSEVDLAALLALYRKMHAGKPVVYDETNPLCPVLRLSGVAKVSEGKLLVRNRIYAHVFDRDWIETHMPDAEKRRQRQAYRAGILRATLVAGGVAMAMALLAVFAFTQWREASRNAKEARDKTTLAKLNEDKERRAHVEADVQRKIAEMNFGEAERQRKTADKQRHAAVDAQRLAAQNLRLAINAGHSAATAKTRAENEARLARAAEQKTNRLLYDADMSVAQQAYGENNVARTLELLYRHRHDPERGFEWGYLYHLCHQELTSHQTPLERGARFQFLGHGRFLATDSSGKATIRDAATGQEQCVLKGQTTDTFSCVALSPDGKRIATVSYSDKKAARVWDASTGQELLTLPGAEGFTSSVAFSPDGKRIVISSNVNAAKVWDASTGQVLLMLIGVPGAFSSVAFSPDGKRIVAGGQGTPISVWDATTGKQLLRLSVRAETAASVAFSPDGKRIVVGNDKGVIYILDATTGQDLKVIKGSGNYITYVAFSPDSKRIITSAADGMIKEWDGQNDPTIHMLNTPSKAISCVAFSPDNRRLATGNSDGTATVSDPSSCRELLTLPGHKTPISGIAFSPDNKSIVTGSTDGVAIVWDAITGKQRFTLSGHTESISSLAFSPDGKRIVTGRDNTVNVWDALTGKQRFTLPGRIAITASLAFSPDSKRIITGTAFDTAKVWDIVTGKEMFAIAATVSGVLFRSDTGKNEGYYAAGIFSPDGKRIVTRDAQATAHFWDAQSGKELFALHSAPRLIYSMAFSPDSTRIITCSGDTTATVWNTAAGQELFTLQGSSGAIFKVMFSPDGKRILTVGIGNTATLWDAQTGAALITLSRPEGSTPNPYFGSTDFSSDGRHVVTMAGDRAMSGYLWDGRPAPDTEDAWAEIDQSLLWSYEQGGKWPQAIDILSAMIRSHPTRLDYRERRANAYAASFQWRKALPDFKAAAPTYRVAGEWSSLALLYAASGDAVGYRRTCEMMLHKYGAEPFTAGEIGEACAFAPGALTDYTPLLTLLRRQAAVQPIFSTTLGKLQYRAGRFRECRETLTPLLDDSSAPNAWMCLAMADNQLGNREEARRLLIRGEAGAANASHVRPLFSSRVSAWFSPLQSELLMREAHKRIGSVSASLVAAEKHRMEQRVAWSQEALGYERTKQWTEAIPLLTRLIQADPSSVTYRVRRGLAYAETGHWAKALADYKRFAPNSQDDYDRVDLGLLALAVGDNRTYQTACRSMLGHSAEAFSALGWICHAGPHALFDYTPLLNLLATKVKQDPKDTGSAQQLGSVQYWAGLVPEAIQTLTSTLKPDTPNADYWFILAMAHSQAGHPREARQAFDTGVQAMTDGAFLPDLMSDQWDAQLHWQGQFHQAADVLKTPPATVAAIEHRIGLLRQARRWERTQQWPQEIAALTSLIQAEPENVPFHFWRGSAYLQTKHLAEALADFKHHLIPSVAPESLPKSQDGPTAFVMFYNNTPKPVQLFWIGFDGKPVYYGYLPPYTGRLQATVVTHVWLITDFQNKPLAGYVTPPMGGLVLFEAK